MKRGAHVSRREMMITALATGFAAAFAPRSAYAKALHVAAPSADGIVPGAPWVQTAALQSALDRASRTGQALFLPPGTYRTGRLSLKSGAQVRGVPGRTVLLAHASGSCIFDAPRADTVSLSGLVLDGGGAAIGDDGALVDVAETADLKLTHCQVRNSRGHGVSLRRSSGRIAFCGFYAIGETAVSCEGANSLATISHNVIDTAATGIAVVRSDGARVVAVNGNRIRNLFQRKIGACGGVGIAVDGDCRVAANVIEGAPAYGVLVGASADPGNAEVTSNAIRKSHIGIGVTGAPGAGRILIAENVIDGTKDGGIRAMNGPRPVGPDLAHTRDSTRYRLAVHANVSR